MLRNVPWFRWPIRIDRVRKLKILCHVHLFDDWQIGFSVPPIPRIPFLSLRIDKNFVAAFHQSPLLSLAATLPAYVHFFIYRWRCRIGGKDKHRHFFTDALTSRTRHRRYPCRSWTACCYYRFKMHIHLIPPTPDCDCFSLNAPNEYSDSLSNALSLRL